jgi:hypothetical protein
VPQSALGEQQCSARHDEQDGHHDEDEPRPSPVEPEDDVAADVKWQEYDREQGCDGQCVDLHWCPVGRVEGGLIWLSHTRAIRPGFSTAQYTYSAGACGACSAATSLCVRTIECTRLEHARSLAATMLHSGPNAMEFSCGDSAFTIQPNGFRSNMAPSATTPR